MLKTGRLLSSRASECECGDLNAGDCQGTIVPRTGRSGRNDMGQFSFRLRGGPEKGRGKRHPCYFSVSSVVNSFRCSRGFTLLEILIVTILIALVASIGIPRFLGSIERAQVKSTAGKIANVMRIARLRAVSEKKIITVEVDTKSRTVRALYGGGENERAAEPIKIPESISLLTGRSGAFYSRPMSFEFNPTGGATGGDLYVMFAGAKPTDDEGYVIRLEPLSGNAIVISASEL